MSAISLSRTQMRQWNLTHQLRLPICCASFDYRAAQFLVYQSCILIFEAVSLNFAIYESQGRLNRQVAIRASILLHLLQALTYRLVFLLTLQENGVLERNETRGRHNTNTRTT